MLAMGCDDDPAVGGDGGTPDGGGTGDGGASACTDTTTTGNLTITISGLPAAVSASVAVAAGSAAPTMVTASQTLMVAGGSYTITAQRVAGPADPIARTAYEPTVTGASGGACVRAGMTTTVTVSYALIATSNKLWFSNGNGDAAMLAYAPSALAASGMPAAGVAAKTKSSAGFTFDPAGNVWALASTTADPPIARYPAASLGASGVKLPDIEIESPSFGGGSPGPKVLAFDRSGNLWTTVGWADKIVKFNAAQIAASGNPTAAVELTGLDGPSALAFDMTGNRWVSAGEKVMRIDASRLAASGAGADLTIQLARPAMAGELGAAYGLAFDAAGNLWVQAGLLCRLTPSDLAGTGSKTVDSGVQIEMRVTALPVGLAFDESGGLWLASSAGAFVRFAPAQLAASGMPAPERVITSSDVGHADYFGIYPAPAALPLHHRLP
jgi:sugar lactone lactonase YvrE